MSNPDSGSSPAILSTPRVQRALSEALSETQLVGVSVVDADGVIQYVNEAGARLVGREVEDVVGLAYSDTSWRTSDLDGNPFGDGPRALVPRVMATGVPLAREVVSISTPNNTEAVLAVSAAPIRDDDGRPMGVVFTYYSVAEERVASERLKSSERKFRALFDAMDHAFSLHEVIRDEDGRPVDYLFLEVSSAFEALTQIPASTWIGSTVLEVLPQTERPWIELIGEVAETGQPKQIEQYAAAFDRYYEVYAYSPAPGQAAALSRDVTERRRRERATLQRSRLDAVGTLAAGVAHDLNNLMVGVVGGAELIRTGVVSGDDALPILEQISSAGEQAGRMAKQLLSFSRSETPRTELLGVMPLLAEAVRLQSSRAGSRFSVEVVEPEDGALWPIVANRSQLVQVLINLLLNAKEAAGGDGSARVHARNVKTLAPEVADRADESFVCISVQDDGPGMPSSVCDRVFEPFYSTKQEGRGLGLAAVHGIIKSHDGEIAVQSEVGVGTTFDIYLPARPYEAVAVSSSMEPGTAQAPARAGRRVLIIDDDAIVRTIMRQMATHLGFEVLEASGGVEGLALAQRFDGSIDVAILDLSMPDLAGQEVFPALRRLRPALKVLVSSGTDSRDEVASMLEAGARFITKPLAMAQLERELGLLLDDE